MTHDELEQARRQFMKGEITAGAYYAKFEAYWSQFKN